MLSKLNIFITRSLTSTIHSSLYILQHRVIRARVDTAVKSHWHGARMPFACHNARHEPLMNSISKYFKKNFDHWPVPTSTDYLDLDKQRVKAKTLFFYSLPRKCFWKICELIDFLRDLRIETYVLKMKWIKWTAFQQDAKRSKRLHPRTGIKFSGTQCLKKRSPKELGVKHSTKTKRKKTTQYKATQNEAHLWSVTPAWRQKRGGNERRPIVVTHANCDKIRQVWLRSEILIIEQINKGKRNVMKINRNATKITSRRAQDNDFWKIWGNRYKHKASEFW